MTLAEERKLIVQNLRLSTRYHHALFPLDVMRFARAIESIGYMLETQVPRASTVAITRNAYVGPLARKDTTIVDVNSEKQFVGISDSDSVKLVERFNEIAGLLADSQLVGGPLRPWFVEVQCHLEYRTEKSPLAILARIGEGMKGVESLKSVIGGKASLYNLKVASASTTADSPNYCEVLIEPAPARESSSLEVIVIKRNEKTDEVVEFCKDIVTIVGEALHSLET